MGTLILILVIVSIVIVIVTARKTEAIGNWGHLFADMQQDSEEFYKLVEEILKANQVPGIHTRRMLIKEGGLFSYQRVYLEVIRGEYTFHICAAPWGKGFFFSWWLREEVSDLDAFIKKIPIIGPPIYKIRQYKPYYKLDTDGMFRTSVHQSVLAAIDELTEAKGMRGLTELERKPDLRAIIK